MVIIFRSTVYIAILLLSAVDSLPAEAASGPVYSNGVSVIVPFVNAKNMSNSSLYSNPEIRVGFTSNYNSSFTVVMDTGSVGIIVGKNYFTDPGTSSPIFIGAGSETLTSSGIVYSGNWYTATVYLYNSAAVVAVSTVPVMAVNSVSCTKDARECNITDHTGADVHYFGIGFSGGAGLPQGTPEKNAFLNVTNVPGASAPPSPGYILSTQGVQIGLTSSNTQGFALIKLEPLLAPNLSQWQRPPASPNVLTDWQHARGTISVNGVSSSGSVLFDTGVGTGFLTPPTGVTLSTGQGPYGAECNTAPPTCAVSGTTVQISFPDQANPVASFGYVVGANNGPQTGNPVSPLAVAVVRNSSPFLNTAVHFLQAFDYLYDAANGFVGLRTTNNTPPRYATSTASGLGVGGVFQCFFGWAKTNFGSARTAYQAPAYSWPYTYIYNPGNQTYVEISSGNLASSGTPATEANNVYIVSGGQTTDKGALSGWLITAGCQ
jgi:hypothetical protein